MKISFSTAQPASVAVDALVVFVSTSGWRDDLAALDAAMGGGLVDWLDASDFDTSVIVVPTYGRIAARNLVLVPCRNGVDALAVAKAGRKVRTSEFATVALSGTASDQVAVVVEHLAVGNYAYDPYVRETDRTPKLAEATLLGLDDSSTHREAAASALVRARWQDWTRDLVNGPPADIYPESLAKAAVDAFADLEHVTVEVKDFATCEAEGMVGIVAVGQGSAKPGCMIHIQYHPPGATEHIAFVGKGVTFDAGGLSIKPSSGMQTMRCDMGGAATVLGATGAIAELKTPVKVDCFVGAVENMVGANSFKLGDILRYRNGVTVEIHNTDAEGRLVMADCLIEACAVDGVTTVVDAATLTGACVVAVGEDFTGMFTADDGLASELQSAADAAGDGLWRLPLHQPYNELLKAKWAQIKNVGTRAAGATTAALYLQHFVTDDVRWCHLDIAGSSWRDSASKAWAPGATGQMVRGLTNWVATLPHD